MIIAISGKIGSGKDTVGRILQMLIANPTRSTSEIVETLKEYEDSTEQFPDLSTWENRKFADKLKDIVCILLGCTREQLEDREFKEKELGEEWEVYKITQYDFEYIIKYDEYNSYPIGEKIYSTKEEALKDVENQIKLNPNELNMDFFYEDLIPQKMTPRLLMQLLGTECGRQIIHPNIWVNVLFADYKAEEDYKAISEHFSNCRTESERLDHHRIRVNGYFFNKYPNWIITDMRFPNEVKAVEDRGGITIRVNRYCYDSAEDFLVTHPDKSISKIGIDINMNENSSLIDFEEPAKIHGYIPLHEQPESETALDDYEDWDYTIENNGSLEELVEKVREILKKCYKDLF